jgi:predicted Rossmann fold flavoprotein
MLVDVAIIGAGAAGMMCAFQAAQRGRRVQLLDHSTKLGGKILISGGGRCNFTNVGTSADRFVSENEHFCKSALNRYPPEEFIALVQKHGIAFHEKKLGQLFCDHSARDIVKMLEAECLRAKVEIKLGVQIQKISKAGNFEINLGAQNIQSKSLVIATGGLSIPSLGASPFGYEIAKQFGLNVVPTFAALDGFVFDPSHSPDAAAIKELSGISVDCLMTCNGKSFRENILFTHRGLSGPAALQASLYWRKGDSIEIDLLPNQKVDEFFLKQKNLKNPALLAILLGEFLPLRLVEFFISNRPELERPLMQISDKVLLELADQLKRWKLYPTHTVGYAKAEVTRGGVDTNELSSKTMEAKKVPRLYFIGEVVDVTGWLGGYNFQWAWSSAWAAAQAV